MSRAASVAKEFVKLSYLGEEADPLTHMRLQKLLYYAQAWSLIVRCSELFSEDLRGWKYGPVVREIYDAVPDGQGAKPLAAEHFADAPDLSADGAEFVRGVWEAYKGFSASGLSKMTHQELPWQNARKGLGTYDKGDNEIIAADIEAYFTTQDVPGPIAAYEHKSRKDETEAAAVIASRPAFDRESLARAAKLRSATAHAKQTVAAGG